jgi:hypothetical protein
VSPAKRRHAPAGLVGVVVGLCALLALGSTAIHATRSETRLVTSTDIRQADASNTYYSCLEAEAHSLVRPHDVVFLADPDLARWVTVTKAVGGWADLTLHRGQATVALLLEHTSHGPTCSGDVLVSIRNPHGHVVMVRAKQHTP